MVGGDLLVAFSQGFGTPIALENVPHPLAQCRVIFRCLDGLIKDIGKDRQHLFFKLAMSVLQLLELLFGCGARAPHAFEEHLNQLISCPNLGLIEKTDQQAVAPSPVKCSDPIM